MILNRHRKLKTCILVEPEMDSNVWKNGHVLTTITDATEILRWPPWKIGAENTVQMLQWTSNQSCIKHESELGTHTMSAFYVYSGSYYYNWKIIDITKFVSFSMAAIFKTRWRPNFQLECVHQYFKYRII